MSLRTYLALQHVGTYLDSISDPLAEEIRIRMDSVWLGLSAEDRKKLDFDYAGTVLKKADDIVDEFLLDRQRVGLPSEGIRHHSGVHDRLVNVIATAILEERNL